MSTFLIWGMGLLGASLARDLRKKGHDIIGVEKSPQYRDSLKNAGFPLLYAPDNEKLFSEINQCKGIIICTPVDQIPGILRILSEKNMPKEIWVTDMASTKNELMIEARKFLDKISFIGSHPMTGSDLSGPDNARDDLFSGATIFITPPDDNSNYDEIISKVSAFWKDLGAHPSVISSKVHDKWAAYLSHGLHLVSCMVSCLLEDIPEVFEAEFSPAGGSFRDITRVAGSNPHLWDGIISSNSREVTMYLESLEKLVQDWKKKLSQGELPIKEVFERSAKIRSNIVKSKERNNGNHRV